MCQRSASTARPSSIAPRITPSMSSVCFARGTRGCLNSGTPFAIAATPVSALHPAEKAFSTSSTLTVSSACAGTRDRPESRGSAIGYGKAAAARRVSG